MTSQAWLRMGPVLAVLVGVVATGSAGPALAQGLATAGSVTGTVIAAATTQPIPNAVVVLEAVPDGAVVMPAASGGFLGRTLTAITGPDGVYRFIGLPRGRYRLLVRHLGYHQANVEVDLERAEPFRVSVGLQVNPILLEAMDVGGATLEPYGRNITLAEEARAGRMAAEQYRDQRFLEGDAAVLTHADVTEAVTLGETDLFRALQRLGSVSTRDDFTAAMWTRGAPWSQTRVYYDGLPLFNPVHAIGVLSGINPDAIGAASFHPGGRSASLGEGAAGVLNVESRGAGGPGMRGLGELSVVSARAAADWGSPGGRFGVMAAARRSYVDLVTRLARSLSSGDAAWIPYAFHDLSARVDADLGAGHALEVSGLWSQDGVSGGVPDLLRETSGSWGNTLGRMTLASTLGGLRTRNTVGFSRFSGNLRPDPLLDLGQVPSHALTRNSVSVLLLGTEFAPAHAAGRPWSAGAQLQVQRQRYFGQYPRPYPVIVLDDTLVLDEQLAVVSLWGERRTAIGPHAALEAGLRLDLHEGMRNATTHGLAPRLTARYTPDGGRVTLTAAAARSWQYTQALAPAGPSVGPDLYLTDVWLLAGDTIPAIRADVGTLGAELWLGSGWVASAHWYTRRSTGVAVPDPLPGRLNRFRYIQVPAVNRAHGLEVSARRLVGRLTTAVSWSWGNSTLEARSPVTDELFAYPASQDRRHTFDATAMLRLGGSFRVGGAFTAATGAPYSRFLLGLACDTVGCSPQDTIALQIEQPNGERTASYASLDLLFDWTRESRTWRIGAFLQLRNALNLLNAITYTGTIDQCANPAPPRLVPVGGGRCDRFNRGVSILPLAGVRISF